MKLNYQKSKNPPTKQLMSVWHKATLLMCCFIFLIGKQSIASPILLLEKFDAEIGIQESVTGTITDNKGMPLPGVNVQVKNTDRGTITNFDGKYTIIANGDDTLIISFLGFKTQEISVEGRTSIDVSLLEDVGALDEVVVVGYGTQSKRNVTGAISSVDVTENENLPNVNVAQSLSGVAGVQFTSTPRPGQNGNLLIRGQNSLSGKNDPLIVLDGIIFNGSLADINPQDIQTLDILKDASSAAIYGSRAANGVILITSKKGTTKKPKISINTFFGLSEPTNRIKLLSGERYIERRLDWRSQTGLEANPANIANYLSETEAVNYSNGLSQNPFDVISQQGQISSIDLSVSGREANTNYYLSTSFSEDKGLILNDSQKRTTFRVNINNQITDWLQVGLDATYSHRDLSGISASVSDAYRNSPYGTWYYPDGQPNQFPVESEQAGLNPLRISVLTSNEEIQDNLFSNFYAVLDIPFFEGLSYRVNYSPNKRWYHNYNYERQDEHVNFNNTNASKINQGNFDWVLENIVNYKRQFGDDHTFDLTLLYSRNHTELESTTANADMLNIDALGYNDLGLGSILTNTSFAQSTESISYMGRLNYQFKRKYLFTATVRRDGSSVFSSNNKFAVFPSAALAWLVSEEPFMENVDFVDYLKFRTSYGAVGNQAIEPYQSLSLSATERYVFGNGGPSSIGVVTSTLGNNDLKWETTYSANVAVDFNLFNGRLGGTIEFYNANTEDLLVRRSIPVMNGYSSYLTNIGKVNNKGLEVSLNSSNIQNEKFQWNTNLSFTYNKNTIKRLFGSDLDDNGQEDDDIANSWFIGQPINSFYDYVFDGIYQVGDTDIPAGSKPGFVRVKDLNGDGLINAADRAVVGSGGSPEYQVGFRNDFKYQNITLSIFVNSMLGWEAPFNLINPVVPGRSLGQLDSGWWTPENQSNTRPSPLYTNPLGTNWYQSRDFVRIRDISLSYDFDEAILEKLQLSNLRMFLSAKNVYTYTKWLGPDPESGGTYLGQTSNDLYPLPKTIALGLNISF